jgi:hypothetical protein
MGPSGCVRHWHAAQYGDAGGEHDETPADIIRLARMFLSLCLATKGREDSHCEPQECEEHTRDREDITLRYRGTCLL